MLLWDASATIQPKILLSKRTSIDSLPSSITFQLPEQSKSLWVKGTLVDGVAANCGRPHGYLSKRHRARSLAVRLLWSQRKCILSLIARFAINIKCNSDKLVYQLPPNIIRPVLAVYLLSVPPLLSLLSLRSCLVFYLVPRPSYSHSSSQPSFSRLVSRKITWQAWLNSGTRPASLIYWCCQLGH